MTILPPFVIEIWLDIRERFKAIIGDAVLFILVLGVLEIVQLVLGVMHYRADLKNIIEVTHFWGSYSVLVVLIVNLVVKVLISAWIRR
jgi:hypothetical protein